MKGGPAADFAPGVGRGLKSPAGFTATDSDGKDRKINERKIGKNKRKFMTQRMDEQ